MRIKLLDSVYPTGDEVVLVYEATGKVIRPGGLPIEAGVAVFNVETMYNVYQALHAKKGVTRKLVTIVGEVEHPITVSVPIGARVKDVVALAGEITTKKMAFLIGGPMMGNLGTEETVVTKTTNAILVLPEDHLLIRRRNRNAAIDLKRAASSCCQCETCTNLCPRHALGHPIEPHKFMRSAANQDFQNTEVFLDTFFCSSCGLCENFSCPQGLSPRSLIADYKAGLRQAGVKAPSDPKQTGVSKAREYRKVPEERLCARLGLLKYDTEAPLQDENTWAASGEIKKVKIMFSQHIGAPASAVIEKGQAVREGDVIARAGQGLSVNIHASVNGVVADVTDKYAVILVK